MGVHALYTAATGMDAQMRNIDVIANNVANINTDGFRKDRVNFADLFYHQQSLVGAVGSNGPIKPSGVHVGHGVRIVSTEKMFTPGGIIQTGNDMHLAIQGNGNMFFEVTRPDQTTAYTRAGNFLRDSQGRMITPTGDLLSPEITIPAETQSVSISQNGIVTAYDGQDPNGQQIGQITLTRFVNPAGLEPIGDNLFTATASSGDPQAGIIPGENGIPALLQHALEGSNVNAVSELIQLIQGQRAYEINSNVIKSADEALQIANNLREDWAYFIMILELSA
ncbi:MAG: flagellar basal-body rod protein FlgG [Planctomycetota bacterium]